VQDVKLVELPELPQKGISEKTKLMSFKHKKNQRPAQRDT
jgi:hypothetical protein